MPCGLLFCGKKGGWRDEMLSAKPRDSSATGPDICGAFTAARVLTARLRLLQADQIFNLGGMVAVCGIGSYTDDGGRDASRGGLPISKNCGCPRFSRMRGNPNPLPLTPRTLTLINYVHKSDLWVRAVRCPILADILGVRALQPQLSVAGPCRSSAPRELLSPISSSNPEKVSATFSSILAKRSILFLWLDYGVISPLSFTVKIFIHDVLAYFSGMLFLEAVTRTDAFFAGPAPFHRGLCTGYTYVDAGTASHPLLHRER